MAIDPPDSLVPSLLLLPPSLSAPFLHKSLPVAFYEGLRFVIVWFEEEWDTDDREGKNSLWVNRIVHDIVHRPLQVFLSDVPVGS